MSKNQLAEPIGNDLGEVRICDCGGIELCIGPVALHVAADEISDLYELAAAAMEMAGAFPGEQERREAPRRGKAPTRQNFH